MDKKKMIKVIKVAEEFNELLGLDPAIDLKASEKELKEKILEASELRDEGEVFSDDAESLLKEFTTPDKTEEKEVSKSVEKRVKAQKESKKEVKAKPKKEPKEKKISATTLITRKVCEHPEMTAKQIGEALSADNTPVSNGTLQVTVGGTKKVLAILKELGKLK